MMHAMASGLKVEQNKPNRFVWKRGGLFKVVQTCFKDAPGEIQLHKTATEQQLHY